MTHHHFGKQGFGGFPGFHGAHIFSFPKDAYPVGNVQHLMKLVSNDYHRFAVLFHVAHDFKQLLRFLRGKHRRRLVQNQNVRAAV